MITIPGEGNHDIDENGVFKKDVTSYYIPSANQIYEHNSFKFTPQKKAQLLRSEVSFSDYCSQMIKVHREHAITSILFSVATVFLDIVEDKLGNFPLLFLYGPASTGKDQLIESCQSFFGLPQSPIHIGNKVSTQKAQVRKFAQFRNFLVHLSEYRPGDQQLDELLKGFWDRRGYERGTIDSAFGTETVPVTSSVIFTGNHYPDDDALITRVICEEMTKTEFNHEEKKEYQALKDLTKRGVSYMVADLLQHRGLIQEKFKEQFRKVEKDLKTTLAISDVQERMISNVAILASFYELLKDKVMFPFKYADYSSHISNVLQAQSRKLNTASISMKWWDCFLACIRTKNDSLIHGKEFEVKDNHLYFNFTHCYNRVSMQWWAQYHEQSPTKSRIDDMVKKDFSYEQEKSSHRMEHNKTSVMVLNAQKMNIYDELMEAIEWQRKEKRDMPGHETSNSYDKNQSNQSSLLPKDDDPF